MIFTLKKRGWGLRPTPTFAFHHIWYTTMPKTMRTQYPKWWLRKTRAEQEEYLHRHKKSKFKLTRRRPRNKSTEPSPVSIAAEVSPSAAKQIDASLNNKPILDKLPPKTVKFLEANGSIVEKSIDDAVTDIEKMLPTKIENLPSKTKVQLGRSITKALQSEKVADVVTVGAVTLAKVGVAVIALAGASVAVTAGAPVAISLLALYQYQDRIKDTWDSLIDQPINKRIGGFMESLFEGIREGSKNKSRIRNAITNEEPDVIPDDKETKIEKASVISSNITEQFKSYIAISKYKWQSEFASIPTTGMTWVRAAAALRFLYKIEKATSDLRVLRSKFLSANEYGYASRSDKTYVELSELRDASVTLIDKLTSSLTEDRQYRESAKAIVQRLSSVEQGKSTITRSMILHENKLTPVYRIYTPNKTRNIFVGHETAATLLIGVTNMPGVTPGVLDRVEMRNRSLSSILKEFELL